MYCKNCGAEIPDDANFCYRCGQDVNGPTISNETGTTKDQCNQTTNQGTEYTIKDFLIFLSVIAGFASIVCGFKLIFDL